MYSTSVFILVVSGVSGGYSKAGRMCPGAEPLHRTLKTRRVKDDISVDEHPIQQTVHSRCPDEVEVSATI